MSDGDVSLIRDEDVLRRMWQQTEDFSRKKEIRTHMYRLREERLRNLYSPEPSGDGKGSEFTPAQDHVKSFADQNFQSMKSKEVRDAGSPPKEFTYRGQDLKVLSNAGWNVEQENRTTDDGRTHVKAVHANIEGRYDVEDGRGQFAATDLHKEAVTEYQDDNTSLKRNETSSNTAAREHVVRNTDDGTQISSTTSSSNSTSKFQQVSSTRHETVPYVTNDDYDQRNYDNYDTNRNEEVTSRQITRTNDYEQSLRNDSSPGELLSRKVEYPDDNTRVVVETRRLPDGTRLTSTRREFRAPVQSARSEHSNQTRENKVYSTQRRSDSRESTSRVNKHTVDDHSSNIVDSQKNVDDWDFKRQINNNTTDDNDDYSNVRHETKVNKKVIDRSNTDDDYSQRTRYESKVNRVIESADNVDYVRTQQRTNEQRSIHKDDRREVITTHEMITDDDERREKIYRREIHPTHYRTPNDKDSPVDKPTPREPSPSKYGIYEPMKPDETKNITTTTKNVNVTKDSDYKTIKNNEENIRNIKIDRKVEEVVEKRANTDHYQTSYNTDYTQTKISNDWSPSHQAWASTLRADTPNTTRPSTRASSPGSKTFKSSNSSLRSSVSPDKTCRKPSSRGGSPNKVDRYSPSRTVSDRYSSTHSTHSVTDITTNKFSSDERRPPTGKSPTRPGYSPERKPQEYRQRPSTSPEKWPARSPTRPSDRRTPTGLRESPERRPISQPKDKRTPDSMYPRATSPYKSKISPEKTPTQGHSKDTLPMTSSPDRKPGSQRPNEPSEYPHATSPSRDTTTPERKPGYKPSAADIPKLDKPSDKTSTDGYPKDSSPMRPSQSPDRKPGSQKPSDYPHGTSPSRDSTSPDRKPGYKLSTAGSPKSDRPSDKTPSPRPSQNPDRKPVSQKPCEYPHGTSPSRDTTSPDRKPGYKPSTAGTPKSDRPSDKTPTDSYPKDSSPMRPSQSPDRKPGSQKPSEYPHATSPSRDSTSPDRKPGYKPTSAGTPKSERPSDNTPADGYPKDTSPTGPSKSPDRKPGSQKPSEYPHATSSSRDSTSPDPKPGYKPTTAVTSKPERPSDKPPTDENPKDTSILRSSQSPDRKSIGSQKPNDPCDYPYPTSPSRGNTSPERKPGYKPSTPGTPKVDRPSDKIPKHTTKDIATPDEKPGYMKPAAATKQPMDSQTSPTKSSLDFDEQYRSTTNQVKLDHYKFIDEETKMYTKPENDTLVPRCNDSQDSPVRKGPAKGATDKKGEVEPINRDSRSPSPRNSATVVNQKHKRTDTTIIKTDEFDSTTTTKTRTINSKESPLEKPSPRESSPPKYGTYDKKKPYNDDKDITVRNKDDKYDSLTRREKSSPKTSEQPASPTYKPRDSGSPAKSPNKDVKYKHTEEFISAERNTEENIKKTTRDRPRQLVTPSSSPTRKPKPAEPEPSTGQSSPTTSVSGFVYFSSPRPDNTVVTDLDDQDTPSDDERNKGYKRPETLDVKRSPSPSKIPCRSPSPEKRVSPSDILPRKSSLKKATDSIKPSPIENPPSSFSVSPTDTPNDFIERKVVKKDEPKQPEIDQAIKPKPPLERRETYEDRCRKILGMTDNPENKEKETVYLKEADTSISPCRSPAPKETPFDFTLNEKTTHKQNVKDFISREQQNIENTTTTHHEINMRPKTARNSSPTKPGDKITSNKNPDHGEKVRLRDSIIIDKPSGDRKPTSRESPGKPLTKIPQDIDNSQSPSRPYSSDYSPRDSLSPERKPREKMPNTKHTRETSPDKQVGDSPRDTCASGFPRKHEHESPNKTSPTRPGYMRTTESIISKLDTKSTKDTEETEKSDITIKTKHITTHQLDKPGRKTSEPSEDNLPKTHKLEKSPIRKPEYEPSLSPKTTDEKKTNEKHPRESSATKHKPVEGQLRETTPLRPLHETPKDGHHETTPPRKSPERLEDNQSSPLSKSHKENTSYTKTTETSSTYKKSINKDNVKVTVTNKIVEKDQSNSRQHSVSPSRKPSVPAKQPDIDTTRNTSPLRSTQNSPTRDSPYQKPRQENSMKSTSPTRQSPEKVRAPSQIKSMTTISSKHEDLYSEDIEKIITTKSTPKKEAKSARSPTRPSHPAEKSPDYKTSSDKSTPRSSPERKYPKETSQNRPDEKPAESKRDLNISKHDTTTVEKHDTLTTKSKFSPRPSETSPTRRPKDASVSKSDNPQISPSNTHPTQETQETRNPNVHEKPSPKEGSPKLVIDKYPKESSPGASPDKQPSYMKPTASRIDNTNVKLEETTSVVSKRHSSPRSSVSPSRPDELNITPENLKQKPEAPRQLRTPSPLKKYNKVAEVSTDFLVSEREQEVLDRVQKSLRKLSPERKEKSPNRQKSPDKTTTSLLDLDITTHTIETDEHYTEEKLENEEKTINKINMTRPGKANDNKPRDQNAPSKPTSRNVSPTKKPSGIVSPAKVDKAPESPTKLRSISPKKAVSPSARPQSPKASGIKPKDQVPSQLTRKPTPATLPINKMDKSITEIKKTSGISAVSKQSTLNKASITKATTKVPHSPTGRSGEPESKRAPTPKGIKEIPRKDNETKVTRAVSDDTIKSKKTSPQRMKSKPEIHVSDMSTIKTTITRTQKSTVKEHQTKLSNKPKSATTLNTSTDDDDDIIIDVELSKSSRENSPDRICPTPVNFQDDVGTPRFPDEVKEPDDDYRKRTHHTIHETESIVDDIVEICEDDELFVRKTDVNRTTDDDEHLLRVTSKVSKLAKGVETRPKDTTATFKDTEKRVHSDFTDQNLKSDECLLSVSEKVNKFAKGTRDSRDCKSPSRKITDEYDKNTIYQDDYTKLSVHDKAHMFVETAENVKTPKVKSTPQKIERPDLTNVEDSLKSDDCLLSVSDKVNKFVKTAEQFFTETQEIDEREKKIKEQHDRVMKRILDDVDDENYETQDVEDKAITQDVAVKHIKNEPGYEDDKPAFTKETTSSHAKVREYSSPNLKPGERTPTVKITKLRSSEAVKKAKALFENIASTTQVTKETTHSKATKLTDIGVTKKGPQPASVSMKQPAAQEPISSVVDSESEIRQPNRDRPSSGTLTGPQYARPDEKPRSSPSRLATQSPDIPRSISPRRHTETPTSRNILSRQPTTERAESPKSRPESEQPDKDNVPGYLRPTKTSQNKEEPKIVENAEVSSRRGSGKFGVELRRTSVERTTVSSERRRSVEHPCIEDIFDLDLLEQMLEKVVGYEQRRRIRSQIRVAKKMAETEHVVNTNTYTKTTRQTTTTQKHRTPERPQTKSPDRAAKSIPHKTSSPDRHTRQHKPEPERDHPKESHPFLNGHAKEPVKPVSDRSQRPHSPNKLAPKSAPKTKSPIRQASPEKKTRTQSPHKTVASKPKPNRFNEYASAYMKKVGLTDAEKLKLSETKSKKSDSKQKIIQQVEEHKTVEEYSTVKTFTERTSSKDVIEVLHTNGKRSLSPDKRQSPERKAQSPERLYQRTPSPDLKRPKSDTGKKETIIKTVHNIEKKIPQKQAQEEKPSWVTNRNLKKITSESRTFSSKKIEEKPKYRAASPSKVISKPLDVITSSYGPGPLDADGKPLFGIRALRNGASNYQVKGTVIRQEFHSRNGGEPEGTVSVTAYSTEPEDLERLLQGQGEPPSRIHGLAAITTTKKFGGETGTTLKEVHGTDDRMALDQFTHSDRRVIDTQVEDYTDQSFDSREEIIGDSSKIESRTEEIVQGRLMENLGNTRRVEARSEEVVGDSKSSRDGPQTRVERVVERRGQKMDPSDKVERTGDKKTVRQSSVKSLTEKYIKSANESSRSERSAYPKAGLILRTATARDSVSSDSSAHAGLARTDSEHSLGSVEDSTVVTRTTERCGGGLRTTTTTTTRTHGGQVRGETSFLDSSTKVSGVQDILTRMKNADIVIQEGDSTEDAEARALLNKFLGATVLMAGMQGYVNEQPAGKITVSQETVRSSSGGGKVTSSQSHRIEELDLDQCWDERVLRQLLEECSDYEQRRRLRARIRTLMAEQEACASAVTEALAAAGEAADGSGSETREEEEVTVTSSVRRNSSEKTVSSSTTTTKTSKVIESMTRPAPKPVSPFAKFRQLEKQNSTNSPNSPKTPQSPGSPSQPFFKFTDPALQASAVTIKERLLQWCRDKTRDYENVKLENFSTSWADGLAFCALLHHFLPDAFDYSQLTPDKRRHNFTLAFKLADEKAGIYPLLDVDDMVAMRKPDWKCVFTYVQSIHRRFKDQP